MLNNNTTERGSVSIHIAGHRAKGVADVQSSNDQVAVEPPSARSVEDRTAVTPAEPTNVQSVYVRIGNGVYARSETEIELIELSDLPAFWDTIFSTKRYVALPSQRRRVWALLPSVSM